MCSLHNSDLIESYLSHSQHSFTRDRSCITQLLHYVHDLATSLDAGEQIDNIYLAMEKAFDRGVLHEKLLHKLEFLGIRNSLQHWIGDYLTDRPHSVSYRWHLLRLETCIFWRPTRLDNWSYSVSYLY